MMMMEEWKQRTQLLLGDEKMERLQRAHVLVVGLGAVSYTHLDVYKRQGI